MSTCEATITQFAWFDLKCYAEATTTLTIDGDQHAACDEHATQPTPTEGAPK